MQLVPSFAIGKKSGLSSAQLLQETRGSHPQRNLGQTWPDVLPRQGLPPHRSQGCSSWVPAGTEQAVPSSPPPRALPPEQDSPPALLPPKQRWIYLLFYFIPSEVTFAKFLFFKQENEKVPIEEKLQLLIAIDFRS